MTFMINGRPASDIIDIGNTEVKVTEAHPNNPAQSIVKFKGGGGHAHELLTPDKKKVINKAGSLRGVISNGGMDWESPPPFGISYKDVDLSRFYISKNVTVMFEDPYIFNAGNKGYDNVSTKGAEIPIPEGVVRLKIICIGGGSGGYAANSGFIAYTTPIELNHKGTLNKATTSPNGDPVKAEWNEEGFNYLDVDPIRVYGNVGASGKDGDCIAGEFFLPIMFNKDPCRRKEQEWWSKKPLSPIIKVSLGYGGAGGTSNKVSQAISTNHYNTTLKKWDMRADQPGYYGGYDPYTEKQYDMITGPGYSTEAFIQGIEGKCTHNFDSKLGLYEHWYSQRTGNSGTRPAPTEGYSPIPISRSDFKALRIPDHAGKGGIGGRPLIENKNYKKSPNELCAPDSLCEQITKGTKQPTAFENINEQYIPSVRGGIGGPGLCRVYFLYQ